MALPVIMLFLSLVDGQGIFTNSTTLEKKDVLYQIDHFKPITVEMPVHQLPFITSSALNENPTPTPGWSVLPPGPAASGVNPGTNIGAITSAAVPEGVPAGNPTCTQCSIYYEYVNVFYWPESSSNTDCLTLFTNSAPPTPAPDPNLFESPSAYVVFPAVSAGNACTRVGEIYTSVTMKFNPGELSTIEGPNGPWKPFNFADLPCPPPGVAAGDSYFYNPQTNRSRPYAPMIAPPAGLWELDPAYRNCVTAIFQGVDPPSVIASASKLTSPKMHFGGPNRHRNRAVAAAAAHANRTPQLPAKTPAPV